MQPLFCHLFRHWQRSQSTETPLKYTKNQLQQNGLSHALNSRLKGELDEAQRQRLLEIAGQCPVHRTLTGEIRIDTALRQS
jgi:uncharacterized OsmC-like protein